MRALEHELRQGLHNLALDLNDVKIDQLLNYLDLIAKWTRVYNLTAVRDPAEMLTHHLLDSLAVIAPLRRVLATLQSHSLTPGDGVANAGVSRAQLLDVGSGAGLPGVVIAICCPQLGVDCVDAVSKKAAFIRQVAVTLGLSNLRGVHARVETMTEKYTVISSRAFASLADFTRWSAPVIASAGVWLAMKGRCPEDEIAALPDEIKVFHVEQLRVPGLGAERCIVWLRRT